MAFFATLSDLIKGCPRNIKRRLFRDILLILFITSGAITAIGMVQGIKTQRDISSSIITKANKSVSKHFQAFIEPLSGTMTLLGKWGEAGLLKQNQVELLATQFQALMEIQPSIHAITIANSQGFETRLSHDKNQWLITEYRDNLKISSHWIDHTIVNRQEQENSGYSSGKTIWFRGAMTSTSDDGYFLSEAHTLQTTDELGITASKRWASHDTPDSVFVSALAFTMEDLMTFMEQFELTSNDRTLLLEKDGTLLSNIRRNSSKANNNHPASGLEVSEELLEMVTAKLSQNTLETDQAISLKYKGKTWWLGLSPLDKNNYNIWVAILIPEDDIFNDLKNQWKQLALLIGSILLLGIVMTIFLVRRYSHQLKDLPQQHVDMYSYENEIKNLIRAGESTSLEFKSTMRTNLRTGKAGKEIELAWLKAVIAFMNSDGGILLIGVADDGEVLGLDDDNFANEDKLRLHFKNLLNNHIGAEFTRFISLKVVALQEKTILIVECERVRRPVFLTVGKNEDFFIRSGPSSIKLSMSQMVRYLSER